jgi:hypothetical protein
MSDIRTGKQISDRDQMIAAIEDLSKSIAQYRNGLIEAGIPKTLADKMAGDVSKMFWIKALGGILE